MVQTAGAKHTYVYFTYVYILHFTQQIMTLFFWRTWHVFLNNITIPVRFQFLWFWFRFWLTRFFRFWFQIRFLLRFSFSPCSKHFFREIRSFFREAALYVIFAFKQIPSHIMLIIPLRVDDIQTFYTHCTFIAHAIIVYELYIHTTPKHDKRKMYT